MVDRNASCDPEDCGVLSISALLFETLSDATAETGVITITAPAQLVVTGDVVEYKIGETFDLAWYAAYSFMS
jgi:hypothetical protein